MHRGMPRLPQRMEMPILGVGMVVSGMVGVEMLFVGEEMGRESVMDGLGASRSGLAMVVLEK